MTTFLYTTTSTTASVSDVEAVASLLDEYYFTVDPTFDQNTGKLSFYADAEPFAFDVYKSSDQASQVAEEFFERLAAYVDGEFEVKCVEVQGHGEPAAYKWSVSPNGDVTFHSF